MEIPQEALNQLKMFVGFVKAKPDLLHLPQLVFFKEFIESFGGKIPPPSGDGATSPESGDAKSKKAAPEAASPPPPPPAAEPEPKPEPESEESDVELDNSGVIESPDTAPAPLKEYDPDFEVTEENIDKSNEKKVEAISAFQDGEFDKAYQLYSEAIEANPNSALLYAKRGQCSLKLSKPNACKRDCARALLINPDCAPAYKFRGRAHRLLGEWEEAAKDLRNACKIDFDEQADDWLREVTPNARKLEEHRRKYERKHAERELRERKERVKRAREEHAKAAAANAANANQQPDEGSDGSASDFFSFMNDPDLKSAFMDPEVMAAFEDITSNPTNILKYQDNPKIIAIIEKMRTKYGGQMGGLGGMMGGLGGMMGGLGGAFNPFSSQQQQPPPPPPPSAPSGPADVDLD